MLRALLEFELAQRLRQPAVLLIAAVCFGYGVTISQDAIGEGMVGLSMDAPYRLAYFIALGSSLSCLLAMLFFNQDVLRDSEHRFSDLIGLRSPLTRWRSRAWVTCATVLGLASLLAMGIWSGFVLSADDVFASASPLLQRVLMPWILFVLPNVAISCALISWVSLRWRRAPVTFAAAFSLLLLSWLCLGASGAPVLGHGVMARGEELVFLRLFDPFGLVAFFEQTQFWTPLQKNVQLPQPDAGWVSNRIFWLLPCGMAYWQSRRLLSRVSEWGTPRTPQPSVPSPSVAGPGVWVLPAGPSESTPYAPRHAVQLAALMRRQLVLLHGGMAMPLFLLIWIGLVAIGIAMAIGAFSADEFSGRYPSTSVLISQCAEPLSVFATALMVLYSSELMLLERRQRIHELIDAARVPNSLLFAAKLAALFSIPLALISLLGLVALGYQVAVGQAQLHLEHYLALYYYFGLPLFLKALALLSLQALCMRAAWANRYTCLLFGASFVLLVEVLLPRVASEFPGLQLNQFPSLVRAHSDWSGYGELGDRFGRLALHWSLLAVAIAAVAVWAWPRGAISAAGWPCRHRAAGLTAIIGLLAWSLSAIALQAGLPEEHDYLPSAARLQSRGDYERQFAEFRGQPVPQASASRVWVDLYPEQQTVAIRAENQLHNRSNVAMHRMLLTSRHRLESVHIEGAQLLETVNGIGWHAYRFDFHTPWAPGAEAKLLFRLRHRSQGFAVDASLVENGSYFHHGQFEPAFGYVEALEIQDAEERQRQGLSARAADSHEDAHGKGSEGLIAEKRRFDVVFATSAEQVPVSSGERVQEWGDGVRHFAHYRVEKPVHPMIGYFSGAYARRSFTHRGLPIEFYLHPEHALNVDAMLAAVRATIDYCERWFGKYPYASLRIVEVPRSHGFGGRAAAGVIALNERLFVEDAASPALINNVLRNTIHEVAHQWWGELLVPSNKPGQKVLTESLAKYVEAQVLGEMQGVDMRLRLNDYNRRRYFAGRAHAPNVELPLVDAQAAYLSYGKGPVVLLALSAAIGESQLNGVLAEFIRVHQSGMTATTRGLRHALRAAAPLPLRSLVDAWLAGVVEYRLRLEHPEVEQVEDGRYRVSFDLLAERIGADTGGQLHALAIDEVIDLDLQSAAAESGGGSERERHRVRVQQARTRIRLLSEVRPVAIIVDPEGTRIEADHSDNRLDIHL